MTLQTKVNKQVGKLLATNRTVSILTNFLCGQTCLTCEWLWNTSRSLLTNQTSHSSHEFTSFVTNYTRWQLKMRRKLHSTYEIQFNFLANFSVSFLLCVRQEVVIYSSCMPLWHKTWIRQCCYFLLLLCLWNVDIGKQEFANTSLPTCVCHAKATLLQLIYLVL